MAPGNLISLGNNKCYGEFECPWEMTQKGRGGRDELTGWDLFIRNNVVLFLGRRVTVYPRANTGID